MNFLCRKLAERVLASQKLKFEKAVDAKVAGERNSTQKVSKVREYFRRPGSATAGLYRAAWRCGEARCPSKWGKLKLKRKSPELQEGKRAFGTARKLKQM